MTVSVRNRLLATLATAVLGVAGTRGQTPPQQPVFKSGVELVMVDVQVVDKKGVPIPALRPDQFDVSIDGKRRQIVSAQLVDAATGVAEAMTGAGAQAAGAKPIQPGNVYVLAVDQGSFHATNAPSVVHAVREFVKRLGPNDYLGLVSFPSPGLTIDPTREREPILSTVARIVGFGVLKQSRLFRYSLSDAIDVASGDRTALAIAVERNCQPKDAICPQQLQMEMTETIGILEMQSSRSLDGLRGAISMVASIPGRKTMVVISAGIPSGDRSGNRLAMSSAAKEAGKQAADSGMLLYTLHMNTTFLDAFSPTGQGASQTLMREASVYARGLEIFNGTAVGTFLEVNTGPDFAIDRVVRETSKYYLLGVEPQEADRDGKSHSIRVKVNQSGSSVRNRATVVIPQRGT